MEKLVSKKNSLVHIAFIMDGNGRWAKKRNLPRTAGHKEGCERVADIYRAVQKRGIKVMSLYAFSTENWNRPKSEISLLFKYLDSFFNREVDTMIKDGVRVIVSGDVSRLPIKTQETIKRCKELTKDNTNFVFNICLNYGGKAELIRACKNIASDVKDGKLDIDDINESSFEDYLYTAKLPPVDLLIRTSGEQRISNYMLWQLAYSEFIFTPTAWPDFREEQLEECLKEYEHRNRRFGEIKDEK